MKKHVWSIAYSDSNQTPARTHTSVKSKHYGVIAEIGNYFQTVLTDCNCIYSTMWMQLQLFTVHDLSIRVSFNFQIHHSFRFENRPSTASQTEAF